MKRVTHLTCCLAVLAAFLLSAANFTVARAAETADASPRADLPLNAGWKFMRQDITEAGGGAEPNLDDGSWTSIDLPHTYNNKDGQDGGNDYYRGPTWYRKHFTIEPELAGRNIFLKFDGAATTAEVFVNGQPVGKHAGNFGAFCFDITSLINTTNDNLIAVKVDNTRNTDIPPLSGDFTVFGGLYRGVHLLALQEISISPMDFASPGVYLKQTNVTAQQADVEITVKLHNAGAAAKDVEILCILLDAAGHEVQRVSAPQKALPSALPAAAGAAFALSAPTAKLSIANPHLWNGIKDPYLYHVAVEVRDGDTLTDRVIQPLGLRFIRIDPNLGFFLNGQPYAVHGVNRHQDRLDKGWAISDADHEEDFQLIKEMGVTGLRLAHYEHAQHFYDLCDQNGMIVWAELCLVNNINPTDAFKASTRQQLTELIKQNYNHPAIVMWGLFNELSFGPEPLTTPGPHTWDFIGDLNTQAHELDPTRLTTSATNRVPEHPVNVYTDVLAFNRYYGWYTGKVTDWAAELDKIHAALPTRAIAISEYGAGASILQHQIPPAQPRPVSAWHPEEWQALVHEIAWKAQAERPWIWGHFLWNMFDFAVDDRKEGDTLGRNDKGLVTYDRKTKKDAFFFYQANWTDTPMVHINSRRFTPRPLADAPIKIYSNGKTVELKLNGQSLGVKQSADHPDHIFIWDNAKLKEGENTLEARATTATTTPLTDTCTIAYDPKAPASQPAP